MISEDEALQRVLAAVQPGPVIDLPLLDAAGLGVARRLTATVPLPGFDNSMVDGYALRAADSASGRRLPVTGCQPAGADLGLRCGPGEAVRLFTGAPLPAGADAVLMQEDADTSPEGLLCREPVQPGENVRRAGAELCAGQVLLEPGDRLTASKLGLLASQGLAAVPVHQPPRAAVLSTGDELRTPGEALAAGQIYNSNAIMLQALLRGAGLRDTTALHCPDDLDTTIAALDRLAAEREVVLISGGVSVGDHDHVKPALRALGVATDLWRVRVKPGKPFLFARQQRGNRHIAFFGLPGNPVSAFVTFELFVRPALHRLLGLRHEPPLLLPATCGQDLHNDGDRPHYLRGTLSNGIFHVRGLQMSHALFGLSQSGALLRLEPGARVAAGERVQVRPLTD